MFKINTEAIPRYRVWAGARQIAPEDLDVARQQEAYRTDTKFCCEIK